MRIGSRAWETMMKTTMIDHIKTGAVFLGGFAALYAFGLAVMLVGHGISLLLFGWY